MGGWTSTTTTTFATTALLLAILFLTSSSAFHTIHVPASFVMVSPPIIMQGASPASSRRIRTSFPSSGWLVQATTSSTSSDGGGGSGDLLLYDETDDDTLETLSQKLECAVALEASRGIDNQNNNNLEQVARLCLFYTRLSNLVVNKTYVDDSPVQGRGLFAACDCQKGDLLTCYPGDALVIIPDGPEEETNVEENNVDADWTILWGEHVDKPYELDDFLMGYLLHAKDEFGVLALPWLDSNPAYLGHFCNDGVTMPTTMDQLSAYVIESNDKANAVHQDWDECHMVTLATKDIKKGEEIFVTYGPDYWIELNQIPEE